MINKKKINKQMTLLSKDIDIPQKKKHKWTSNLKNIFKSSQPYQEKRKIKITI